MGARHVITLTPPANRAHVEAGHAPTAAAAAGTSRADLPIADDARTALSPPTQYPNTPADAAGPPLLPTKCSNLPTRLMPLPPCRVSCRLEVLKLS